MVPRNYKSHLIKNVIIQIVHFNWIMFREIRIFSGFFAKLEKITIREILLNFLNLQFAKIWSLDFFKRIKKVASINLDVRMLKKLIK